MSKYKHIPEDIPVVVEIKGLAQPAFFSGVWLVYALEKYVTEDFFVTVQAVDLKHHDLLIRDFYDGETMLVYFENPGFAEDVAFFYDESAYDIVLDYLEKVRKEYGWKYTSESVCGHISLSQQLSSWSNRKLFTKEEAEKLDTELNFMGD